jgi:hypothetical protein
MHEEAIGSRLPWKFCSRTGLGLRPWGTRVDSHARTPAGRRTPDRLGWRSSPRTSKPRSRLQRLGLKDQPEPNGHVTDSITGFGEQNLSNLSAAPIAHHRPTPHRRGYRRPRGLPVADAPSACDVAMNRPFPASSPKTTGGVIDRQRALRPLGDAGQFRAAQPSHGSFANYSLRGLYFFLPSPPPWGRAKVSPSNNKVGRF